MKRSEMIKKLCEPIQLGNVDLHLWPEEAEAILKVLEDAGMRPPKPQSANTDNPIFLELENYIKLLYKWEPEDGAN